MSYPITWVDLLISQERLSSKPAVPYTPSPGPDLHWPVSNATSKRKATPEPEHDDQSPPTKRRNSPTTSPPPYQPAASPNYSPSPRSSPDRAQHIGAKHQRRLTTTTTTTTPLDPTRASFVSPNYSPPWSSPSPPRSPGFSSVESDCSVAIKLEEAEEDLIDLWEWPEWSEEVEVEERGVPIGGPVIEDEEKFWAVGGVVKVEGWEEEEGERDEDEEESDDGCGQEEGYDGDDEDEE